LQKAGRAQFSIVELSPKARAIKVYGVNFDFNTFVLRPDSTPMLKQVLVPFTGTPSLAQRSADTRIMSARRTII